MRRQTIQRTLILEAVKKLHKRHPTADEVYDETAKHCPTVSRGTVYRNLGLLADEGAILRVALPNVPDRFDDTLCPHAHFLCSSCGRVFDYELPDGVRDLSVEQTRELNPGFEAEEYEIILRGRCDGCAKSGKCAG